MPAIIRLEYVRPRRGGEAYGIADNVIRKMGRDNAGNVVQAETLTVGAASIQSSIAPVFENDLSLQGGVFARVTCFSGAAVIAPPTSDEIAPIATQANGVRIEAGDQPLLFPVETGWRLAFIESTMLSRQSARVTLLDNAGVGNGPVVSGLPGGWYMWACQGNFAGATLTLRVIGPDKATYMDVETMTGPGRKPVVLGERDTVRVVVSGGAPASLYSELS